MATTWRVITKTITAFLKGSSVCAYCDITDKLCYVLYGLYHILLLNQQAFVQLHRGFNSYIN